MSTAPPPEPGAFRVKIGKHRNELGLVIATMGVLFITSMMSTAYAERTWDSAREVLLTTSLLGIFAFGAAIVIIAGGIDLSSGSVIAFSGTIFAGVLVLLAPKNETGLPDTSQLELWIVLVAILATIGLAFLVGSFHAWLVTVIELPPFVATLASLVGLRSLAKLLIQNITAISHKQGKSTITIDNEALLSIGQQAGWWVPVLIWLLLAFALWVLLSKTVVGRHLYAMGGNEEAARLSGIRTDRLKWLAYCIGTMSAAVSGILYTCYVGTADPTRDGLGYELNAIAASVVGGCSLAGGIGTVPGVILGALFLRVVIDCVEKSFKTRPDLFEGLVVGVLVVLAVAFNELRGAGLRKRFFPGKLGIINIVNLSLLGGVIAAVTTTKNQLPKAAIVAGIVCAVLVAKKIQEYVADQRNRAT